MTPKLIIQFGRLNEADFLSRGGLIMASLSDNPRFPQPWPAPAPVWGDVVAAYERYRDLSHASIAGDRVVISQRNTAREVLTELLRRTAKYVEFVAHDDEEALRSTGFELRREPSRAPRSGALPAPQGLKLRRGDFSGQVEVRAGRVEGAGNYELQISLGDPTDEAGWRHALSSPNCTRLLLEGLPRLQICWVRMRAMNARTAGVWSEPVSIMVL